MSKKNQGIEVFLRVRPTKDPHPSLSKRQMFMLMHLIGLDRDTNHVTFTFPNSGSKGGNQNMRDETHDF